MAINTNDCFVAVAGVRVRNGVTLMLPGLDSGSEANTESCSHIPGPACDPNGAGVRVEEGAEGYVHVHRGIQGLADLGGVYDWRNPMAMVRITSA